MKTTIVDCTIYKDDVTFVLKDEFDGIVKNTDGTFAPGRTKKVYTNRKYAFAIGAECSKKFKMMLPIINSVSPAKLEAIRSSVGAVFEGAGIELDFVTHKAGDPILDADNTPVIDAAGNARTYAYDRVEPIIKKFDFGRDCQEAIKFACSLAFD